MKGVRGNNRFVSVLRGSQVILLLKTQTQSLVFVAKVLTWQIGGIIAGSTRMLYRCIANAQ